MQKFHLGITMAGAVSAGAYTAGVIDYLLETLETWEAAKAKNRATGKGNAGYDASVPMHEVEISIFSGASAGGMTASITAAALQAKINHISPDKRGQDHEDYQIQNKLYHSWVNLVNDDMMPILLGTDDIDDQQEDPEVVSVLNASFIKIIAENAVTPTNTPPVHRPYIADRLEVAVSLSNLSGLPFKTAFRGGANKVNDYVASKHLDWGHFVIAPDYKNDGRIAVSFIENKNLDTLRDAAMATGAFPIGLAPRMLQRPKLAVLQNKYINPLAEQLGELSISSSDDGIDINGNRYFVGMKDPYQSMNIDGGMLNNEPFDITQRILLEDIAPQSLADNKKHATFKSCVLMIDPFPTVAETVKFDSNRRLLHIIPQIIGTLRGQLLFKQADIDAAQDDNDYSRFLIAPVRQGKDKNNKDINIEGAGAIACGSLGGFGGFFDKSFRKHDYFLGRRNCQRHLQKYFVVPADTPNGIFAEGYEEATAQKKYAVSDPKGRKFLPIIPTMGMTEETPLPFPQYDLGKLKALEEAIGDRLERVVFTAFGLKGFPWFLAKAVAVLKFRKDLVGWVINTVTKSFKAHGLA